MKTSALAKWYTRVIGVFFVLVALSLVSDYARFGFRPETMHKIFHVALGAIVLRYGWSNPNWWRPFALGNGAFFTYVALFGWLFPDFGGLDAFNRTDTILHSVVGATGLIAGFSSRGSRSAQKTFQCPECKLSYRDEKTAKQCEAWCRERHSCNLEITKHALSVVDSETRSADFG